jgi:hypothetical protein
MGINIKKLCDKINVKIPNTNDKRRRGRELSLIVLLNPL